MAGRILAELQTTDAARPSGSVAMIAEDAQHALRAYSWPGNVRELRNALEYALVVGESDVIGAADLPEEVVNGEPLETTLSSFPTVLLDNGTSREDNAERARITRALANASGHPGRAARILGISRTTLRQHMRRLGVDI